MVTDHIPHDQEQLRLLLEICEDFLRHTGPATHDEIDRLLRQRGITGGPGWLIDMLGLTRLRLQAQDSPCSPQLRADDFTSGTAPSHPRSAGGNP
jgi:hypothetical protein